jgi:Fe2+ or Zn2+ uptake regulation protein
MDKINNLTNITNIKLTSARKSILELLIDSNKPLSYEDMKDNISMDKATFYRNITIFEEENLLLVLLNQMIKKDILKFQKHNIHTLFVHLVQKLSVFMKK